MRCHILLLEQSCLAIHDELFQGCYETLIEKCRVQIYEMHSSNITQIYMNRWFITSQKLECQWSYDTNSIKTCKMSP